ncbi:hypothetical protein STEG23_009226, partial [Scotinomys teguina]
MRANSISQSLDSDGCVSPYNKSTLSIWMWILTAIMLSSCSEILLDIYCSMKTCSAEIHSGEYSEASSLSRQDQQGIDK